MPNGVNHSTTAPIYLTVEMQQNVQYMKGGISFDLVMVAMSTLILIISSEASLDYRQSSTLLIQFAQLRRQT